MQGLGSGQQVWSRSGTAGLGALLFVATACAPMHVTLPSALDGGEVLSVSGRGDFGADYRIGAYRVLPRPRGFATSERSDYLISTALARAESFALAITSPDGAEEEINCALKARIQHGFEESRRYEGGEIECIGEDVVLRRGEVAVAAVERLSAGRVIVAPGAGSQPTRAAVILLAVVNTTENILARWAREAVREEGPREL